MRRDFIYIINNKLHNYNYLKYTLLFYIIILHSYYALFVYLKNNNNMLIFAYFLLLLLCYTKFNMFSYFICYFYLLFTSYLFSINIFSINIFSSVIIEGNSGRNAAKEAKGEAFLKDEEKLGSKVSARRASAKAKLDEDQENSKSEQERGPAGTYLAKRISERSLNITGEGGFKTPPSTKRVGTKLTSNPPKSMNINAVVTN